MVKGNPEKEKYVRVCPKCKSPDVHIDNSNPLQFAMGLPAMYVCSSCQFMGNVFPQVKLSGLANLGADANKESSGAKKDEPHPMVDTSYGNFEVRVWWKIAAPITLLSGVFLLFEEHPIGGAIVVLMGAFMFYITYFRKRKLKD